ncbi:MAG: ROK family protein [bacterium]|nr:ROK family protein [bacterium]
MNRIGIDLGGTKTEIMVTSENLDRVLYRKRVPTEQEKGYGHILNQLAALIDECREFCPEEYRIGMGIPGSLSRKTGRVRSANTRCLIGQDLKGDLETRAGQEVAILNDANCFALSEALLGAGKGCGLVAGIIMGTGMGGGLVCNGKIRQGAQEMAGEWGHSSIDYRGPECWCGQRGCLELYLSGTGIERIYTEETGRRKSLKDIYRDYENKDSAAITVMERMCFYFGRGMANLVCSFDPDIIVVGGGVSNIPLLYTKGVEETRRQLFNDEFTTPIVQNSLGDSSGIYGAAMIA